MADINFTPQRYFQAAQTHPKMTRDLLEAQQHFAAHYFAGVAIECMLRAHGVPAGVTFDSSHSLMYWAEKSNLLAPNDEANSLPSRGPIIEANYRWRANQRYMTPKMLDTHLHGLGLDKIRGDRIKYSANRMLEIAARIIELGVKAWKR